MRCAALVLVCAALGSWSSARAQDAPVEDTPSVEPAGQELPTPSAESMPPMYRELPVPLAEDSGGRGFVPRSAAAAPPVAPRRRTRLGPWELEGRVALSNRSVGPGLAIGYRFARRVVGLVDVSFGFDVADDAMAGASAIRHVWGWAGGLELKAYLQPTRLRRVVPTVRFRAAFGYSSAELEGGETIATYRGSGTPFVGAAIFLWTRVGLSMEIGSEIARLVSSLRYSWEVSVVSRLALVLRW